MQAPDAISTTFNEPEMLALDALFETLESFRFVDGPVAEVSQGLQRCLEHLRQIGQASSVCEASGLKEVCGYVERNLVALLERGRCLTAEEYSLLAELPELLGGYALNHAARHIESVIWHLATPTWPLPLQNYESDALRNYFLPTRPEHSESTNMAVDPAPTSDTEIHSAIDALVCATSLLQCADADLLADMDAIAHCQEQLDKLAKCALRTGLENLASCCETLAEVLSSRILDFDGLSGQTLTLARQFPLLAMDCIAAPDNVAANAALLDLVFDPAWSDASAPTTVPVVGASQTECEIEASAPQRVNPETLLLFAKEFSLMREILAEDLAAVAASIGKTDTLPDAVSNYVDAIFRVGETARSVGLLALGELLETVIPLVGHVADGPDPERWAMLEALPQGISDYLNSPTDPLQCQALVDLLHAPAQPQASTHAVVRSWVKALSNIAYDHGSDDPVPAAKTQATEADISLAIPADINIELLEGLLQELPIQLGTFSSSIGLLSSASGSMTDVESAKRAAHTLKGAANTVGIAGMANLTHHLEELLGTFTDQLTLPDAAAVRLLSDASDCLESMGEAVTFHGAAPSNALAVLQQVLDYTNGVPHRAVVATETGYGMADSAAAPAIAAPDGDASAPVPLLRVPAPMVDELLRLAGENVISTSQIQERLRQTQKQSLAIQQQNALIQRLVGDLENLVDLHGQGAPRQKSAVEGEFDPLEFERYSALHTITNQLIEARTDASHMSSNIDVELRALGDLLEFQRRLQLETQHAVLRTRLIPVSSVKSRLERTVRQTCRQTGKQVALIIVGEATHVDSNLLHELVDPIMHILRNAIDHGIEAEPVRQQCNKPLAGVITLSFSQEGNSIVVRCEDDGAGLDLHAIRQTAVRRNLIAHDTVLSDDDTSRLILVTGFSTREEATQTSGRGIGMDAVHQRVLEMKGVLNLKSRPGQGLTVEMRLPATLLSEHTLMARLGDKLVAVSSRCVQDIHYVTSDQLDVLGLQPIYRVGNLVHKLLHLEDMLGLERCARDTQQTGAPVLLVRSDTGAVHAIMVPQLLDGREVVVKKFGKFVPKVRGTMGAVILGDGSVAPVIDLPELLRTAPAAPSQVRTADAAHAQARVSGAPGAARIALVVDDSISARRANAQLMRDAGYQVLSAIDGLDAVAVLADTLPDIVLVDMEMPRMNGLELTAHLRGRPATRNVPIIMITSRSTEKHRQQGAAAGVSGYLVKPFNEDQLLEMVEDFAMAAS